VINGKISLESARKNYKVVLDDRLKVDQEATKILRAEFRGSRPHTAKIPGRLRIQSNQNDSPDLQQG
jgi:hypothetical protein